MSENDNRGGGGFENSENGVDDKINLCSLGPEAWDDSELVHAFEDAIRLYKNMHDNRCDAGGEEGEGEEEDEGEDYHDDDVDELAMNSISRDDQDEASILNVKVNQHDNKQPQNEREVDFNKEEDLDNNDDNGERNVYGNTMTLIDAMKNLQFPRPPCPPDEFMRTSTSNESNNGRADALERSGKIRLPQQSQEQLYASSEAAHSLMMHASTPILYDSQMQELQGILHAWYYAGYYAGRYQERINKMNSELLKDVG